MGNSNEKRSHRRIDGIVAENASVVIDCLEDKAPLGLKNISYGGFAVLLTDEQVEKLSEHEVVKVELKVLGQSIQTEAKVVNNVGQIYGFSIVYSGVEALMFLRGVFEYWFNGTTCRKVASDKSEAVGEQKKIFINGEGPTDIILSEASEGKFSNATLTYLTDGDYAQIEMKDGVTRTGKSYGESKMPGSSIRMDSAADLVVVRQAVTILAGIRVTDYQEAINQILKSWLKLL